MPQSVCPPKWHRKNAPLSAAVESDVVGYQQTELPTLGFAIVSLPFNELTDDAAGFPIQQIQGELAQSDRESRADKIMVLDPQTKVYTTYLLRKTSGWTKVGEDGTTTDTIASGEGFFYEKVVSDGKLTFSRPF